MTGVGAYSREILWGLAARRPEARYYFCYRPHRFLKSFEQWLPAGCGRRLLLESGPPRRADVFHGLNQRVPSGRLPKTVTTFHDLFVMSGEYSTPEFRARFTKQAKQAAERSDLIICVSAFTASQVGEYLGVPRARLRVVHHGVHTPNPVRVEGAKKRREKAVLFVGSLQARKNTQRLVEAFEQTRPGWKLILAGGYGYGAEEIIARIRASSRADDIDVRGYIDQPTLESLYARASIFAFPSLDEGFGMPLLEAMAWDLPVLTSNQSALAEVSGDAALHVDPQSVGDIARGLQTLMDSEGLREELAHRGRAHAAGFSWDRAVEETWRVYQELSAG